MNEEEYQKQARQSILDSLSYLANTTSKRDFDNYIEILDRESERWLEHFDGIDDEDLNEDGIRFRAQYQFHSLFMELLVNLRGEKWELERKND